MRIYILRALVNKEFLRHCANRGGLALAFLLVAAAVLLSVFNPGGTNGDAGTSGMVGGVHTCIIEYGFESPLIRHLKRTKPAGLRVQFNAWENRSPRGAIRYEPGVGAIQLRTGQNGEGRGVIAVQIWHPRGDPQSMAPYEQWFFREARRHFQEAAQQRLASEGANIDSLPIPQLDGDDLWAVRESFAELDRRVEQARGGVSGPPILQHVVLERQGLGGDVLELRSAIATGMVVFALYFACVYLLPTLNCEERERGALLAQALSPASPLEILAAKFIFYPSCGILLAAILAGIYKPAILSSLFFWLSLVVVASGFLGIGMTIASLARTQRAAFLGGMCYLLSVSLILFICSTNGIRFVQYFAVEYHGPRILHAALADKVLSDHWLNLAAAAALAAAWLTAAAWIFRRRGWQ